MAAGIRLFTRTPPNTMSSGNANSPAWNFRGVRSAKTSRRKASSKLAFILETATQSDGAEVVVTQPRIPCFKMNIKFQRDDMIKRFLASRRSGFYFRVLREGEVGAGDEIARVHEDENHVSVADALNLYLGISTATELRARTLRVPYLSASWRRELGQ